MAAEALRLPLLSVEALVEAAATKVRDCIYIYIYR